MGYGSLPAALRRYVIGVTLLGPLAAVVGAFATKPLDRHTLLLATLLTILAATAERYPIHLTHKTNLNVATATYLAMILSVSPALTGVLALIASAAAQIAQRRADQSQQPPEILFNIGQTALYAVAGGVTYAILRDATLGPEVGEIGSIGAIVAASLAMHIVNTGLVAGAAGLQLGISPFRVWWHNLALDLLPHVTLTVFGVAAALIAGSQPLLLFVLALPGLLIHRAVQQTLRLRADTHEALASLVEVIELRDPYTAGHSRRVATTARLLALRLGLTAEEADLIESAGRVHDIGKAALDQAIVAKDGPLSNAEWEQMKQHPVLGANVVDRFAAYHGGARLVRHHHERWDGHGYPDGLAGDAIPLGARILAVADTFDALTSDRPYRSAMAVQAAVAVLQRGTNSQWDPRVVAAMAALIAERPGDVPVQVRGEISATVHSIAAVEPARPAPPPIPDELIVVARRGER